MKILKCTCAICNGPFEVEDGHGGTEVPCPHCGETILLSNSDGSIPPRIQEPAGGSRAIIKSYTRSTAGTVMLFVLGLLLCFTLVGALIGIPCICAANSLSRRYRCGNCGNPVADERVRKCPTCSAALLPEKWSVGSGW